jgi:hypothetical protein
LQVGRHMSEVKDAPVVQRLVQQESEHELPRLLSCHDPPSSVMPA